MFNQNLHNAVQDGHPYDISEDLIFYKNKNKKKEKEKEDQLYAFLSQVLKYSGRKAVLKYRNWNFPFLKILDMVLSLKDGQIEGLKIVPSEMPLGFGEVRDARIYFPVYAKSIIFGVEVVISGAQSIFFDCKYDFWSKVGTYAFLNNVFAAVHKHNLYHNTFFLGELLFDRGAQYEDKKAYLKLFYYFSGYSPSIHVDRPLSGDALSQALEMAIAAAAAEC